MRTSHITAFKGGWFVGGFEPSLFPNPHVEVGWHVYEAGFQGTSHTHRVGTEINVILHGRCRVDGTEMGPGEIFIYDPGDWSDVQFLETTGLLIVKHPSLPGDKYES